MKKIGIVALFLLSSFGMQAGPEDKMYDAIEKGNVEDVRKILRKMGQLEPEKKKRFLDAAHDEFEDRRKQVSLMQSPYDMAKFISGLGLTVIGGFWGLFALAADSKAFTKRIAWILSATGLASGLWLTAKGYFCDTAEGKKLRARQIIKLIERALVVGQEVPPAKQENDDEDEDE